MNKTSPYLTVISGTLALAGVLVAAESPLAPAPAADSQMVTTLGLTVHKSEFVDNYTAGRDPFFPNSNRRVPKVREVVVAPANTRVESGRIDQLSLKGITGSNDRRLALINNMNFAEGEIGNVRVPGGNSIKVRVLQIAEKSVTLAIEGDSVRHELKIVDSLHDFTKIP